MVIAQQVNWKHLFEIPRYDAVRALGGTALLQTIYKYAYDHQADIDTKCMYFSLTLALASRSCSN